MSVSTTVTICWDCSGQGKLSNFVNCRNTRQIPRIRSRSRWSPGLPTKHSLCCWGILTGIQSSSNIHIQIVLQESWGSSAASQDLIKKIRNSRQASLKDGTTINHPLQSSLATHNHWVRSSALSQFPYGNRDPRVLSSAPGNLACALQNMDQHPLPWAGVPQQTSEWGKGSLLKIKRLKSIRALTCFSTCALFRHFWERMLQDDQNYRIQETVEHPVGWSSAANC